MNTDTLALYWQPYKMFPYERVLGLREAQSLLIPTQVEEYKDKLVISGARQTVQAMKCVYFSHIQQRGAITETAQYRIEQSGRKGRAIKKQNTRYATHGLHEYKGKFNPQVVKALFNIFGLQPGQRVLDPFCGSGTSLVEAAIGGFSAVGTDINPLAVFIANAKIAALAVPCEDLQASIQQLLTYLEKGGEYSEPTDPIRHAYLAAWFLPDILALIENARHKINGLPEAHRSILLALISHVLREYSLQEPSDLRIRRRKSPLPTTPFVTALRHTMEALVWQMRAFQMTEGLLRSAAVAHCADIRHAAAPLSDHSFDFAVTSPPYATALPYIDTQRLSLVWLNLVPATDIRALESDLIGSREFSAKGRRNDWQELLLTNHFALPDTVAVLCRQLHQRLQAGDGFRKQAMPKLLYRYFYDMRQMFERVQQALKPRAYFALIVGHNHTTIGGVRTDIDTPALLGPVGGDAGLTLVENIPLETYQRYGLHMNNAVQKESLLIFQKS